MKVRQLTRRKEYSETEDVLVAAKQRLRYLRTKFEHLVVAFSGGKDSLALLTLLEEVNKEDGITEKVTCVFRDEEVINTSIVNFVQSVAESGRYNFFWMAYPMNVGFNLMGKYMPFTACGDDHKWHRQPPPYAIRSLGADTRKLDEWQVEDLERKFLGGYGRTCILLGMRAAESFKRFTALTSKEKDNWLSIKAKGHGRASPLFDWEEFDVFKWFWESGTPYCPVYEAQMWVGTRLRVSSSLHDRAFQQLEKLKESEPLYYQQLLSVVPELETQLRYFKSIDVCAKIAGYPHTFEGLRAYIDDNIEEQYRPMAHKHVDIGERMRSNRPNKRLGDIPLRYLFKEVLAGKYWGGFVTYREPSEEDIEFEKEASWTTPSTLISP